MHRAAGPLRDGVRSAVLAYGTDNPYVACAAGVLAPIAAAVLLTAAQILPAAHTAYAVLLTAALIPPAAHTAYAVLYERLSSAGGHAVATGGRATATE
ncbi:hypothetical protein [Streptomyces sp. NPDC002164]|uniref:hypothetical protein n=1 Tax=Streptomyces sp. NPDC002164 TaxID=3364633 RepID=UPI00367B2E0C